MLKNTSIIKSFVLIIFITLQACAPSRSPLPQGIIPKPHPISVKEEQYGHQVLTALSEKYTLDFDDPRLNNINDTVEKLTSSIKADKDPWHVYLFKEDSIKNAAATRGNHIFVWSGMLDLIDNDGELAVILSHEIAHVIARHTDPDPNEEARRLLIQLGAVAAGMAVAATTKNPNLSTNIGNLATNLTASVGEGFLINPYSREKEIEADHIGMLIMAASGYNPNISINFWRKLKNLPDFRSNIEYFSSHPPAKERIKKLEDSLPLALRIYNGGAPIRDFKPKYRDKNETHFYKVSDRNRRGNEHLNKNGFYYIVTKKRAILYKSPSRNSGIVMFLDKGARIRGNISINRWLEVEEPSYGYIKLNSIKQLR